MIPNSIKWLIGHQKDQNWKRLASIHKATQLAVHRPRTTARAVFSRSVCLPPYCSALGLRDRLRIYTWFYKSRLSHWCLGTCLLLQCSKMFHWEDRSDSWIRRKRDRDEETSSLSCCKKALIIWDKMFFSGGGSWREALDTGSWSTDVLCSLLPLSSVPHCLPTNT